MTGKGEQKWGNDFQQRVVGRSQTHGLYKGYLPQHIGQTLHQLSYQDRFDLI